MFIMKDWSSPKIKFYKYFFMGSKKPVIMEAYSRLDADNMLNSLCHKTNVIDMNLLEDVRIEMPVKGVSQRKRHGVNHVWVGTDVTSDGWIEESEFKKINNA